MKTKRYYLVLCLLSLIFITSCSKDDEGTVVEPVIEITTDVSDYVAFIVPTDNGQFMRLTVEASAAYDYVGMAIRLKYANNPGTVIPGFQGLAELEQSGNSFTGNFLIPINDLLDDNLKVTLEVAQLTTNENDSYRKATGNTIANPLTITPEFPPEPVTSIHLSEVLWNTSSGKLVFTMNNKEGESGIKGQIYQDGVLIGGSFTSTIVGEDGQGNIPDNPGVVDGTYQVLLENTSSPDPLFTFIDEEGMVLLNSQGEPAASVLLEFTILPEEAVTRVTSSYSNRTTMSFDATMEILKNFSESRDVTIQLLSPSGSVIDSSIFTTTGGGNETFTVSFPTAGSGITLNSNTTYTVKWVFNGVSFYDSQVTTADPGSFGIVYGTVDEITSFSGRVQIIYTNTTGSDVEAMQLFSGIDVDGNPVTSEIPIIIPAGSVNQVMYLTTTGYKQNSQVDFSLEISGSPFISGTFNTVAVEYTNETITNPNDPGMSIIVNAGQAQMTEYVFEFEANGPAKVYEFIYEIDSVDNTDPSGYFDNLQIASSANVDPTWTFDGSTGKYRASIVITENVIIGSNSFIGGFAAEDYTIVEDFNLKIMALDDNGVIIGETMTTIQVKAEL
ncbi:MAG: hypothetical protein ACJAV6_000538 [Candidatus Paceibacteria bacterium]|jgi:hypothetical protein